MSERRGRGKAGGWLALLGLGVAVLVALRFLGPGGAPPEAKHPASPRPRAVTGRVLQASGRPATGAKVEATFGASDRREKPVVRAAFADSGGAFSIQAPDLGATCTGLRVRFGRVSWEGPSDPVPLPAEFEVRLKDSYRVAGLVIAAEDGRPLEGMEVRLGELSARTDRLGRFAFPAVPADAAPAEAVVSGAGRKALRRALPAEGGLDDLLLRVEVE